jgi:hypothetical protein
MLKLITHRPLQIFRAEKSKHSDKVLLKEDELLPVGEYAIKRIPNPLGKLNTYWLILDEPLEEGVLGRGSGEFTLRQWETAEDEWKIEIIEEN